MMAAGFFSAISASGVVAGMISEYTWHSRTRRAMSCAYCAPKSMTSTGPGVSLCATASAYLAGLAGALMAGSGRKLLADRRADLDPGDPPAVEFGHGQPVPVQVGRLAGLRQVAERGEQESGHGLIGPVRQFDAGLLGEVVEVHQAVHLKFAGPQPTRRVSLDVILVLDVADELLDEVFERDDASGAAVLVNDDRKVGAISPHFRHRGHHGLADRQHLHVPGD